MKSKKSSLYYSCLVRNHSHINNLIEIDINSHAIRKLKHSLPYIIHLLESLALLFNANNVDSGSLSALAGNLRPYLHDLNLQCEDPRAFPREDVQTAIIDLRENISIVQSLPQAHEIRRIKPLMKDFAIAETTFAAFSVDEPPSPISTPSPNDISEGSPVGVDDAMLNANNDEV